jgi:hypothetical protein
LIFEIWWNFFYDLFSIKNVADVNSIDSFVSKRNMEEFSVVIMKRFRSNCFKKTKGRHVTYNTRQSVLKCLGGIMHLKPTAGCQISTLIFGFVGTLYIFHE